MTAPKNATAFRSERIRYEYSGCKYECSTIQKTMPPLRLQGEKGLSLAMGKKDKQENIGSRLALVMRSGKTTLGCAGEEAL